MVKDSLLPPKIRNKEEYLSLALIQHSARSPTRAIRNKKHAYLKEKKKLPLFAGNIITLCLHIKFQDITTYLLKLIGDFSKVTESSQKNPFYFYKLPKDQ